MALLRGPGASRWAGAELLAYGGWSGVLVYVGGLLTDAHGASAGATGIALSGGAVAYVAATFLARRWVDRAARPLVLAAGSALIVATVVLGAVRPSFGFSVLMWAVTAFFAGIRMMAGSTAGLDLAGVGALQAMSVRAASMQAGYLAGAVLGGLGLALGGWTVVGVALAVPLLLAVGVTAADYRITARPKVGVR
jgi:predicted MFS family arabinose efflux permease